MTMELQDMSTLTQLMKEISDTRKLLAHTEGSYKSEVKVTIQYGRQNPVLAVVLKDIAIEDIQTFLGHHLLDLHMRLRDRLQMGLDESNEETETLNKRFR